MRILCLDLSLHCGFAIFEDDKLLQHGTLHYEGKSVKERNGYPWSYMDVVDEHTEIIFNRLILDNNPNVIVIEETNKGKNRYSQKMLEWLHHSLLWRIQTASYQSRVAVNDFEVIYLDTSHWRSILGIWMSKEQKKQNAKLSKAKKEGAEALKSMKKQLGVKGKVNKKHVAIAYVNNRFGLKLRVKDNDAADAIALGCAYIQGATPSNGIC